MNSEVKNKIGEFGFESERDYEALRLELVQFLPDVGEQILQMWRRAETSPDFSKMKEDGTIVTEADVLAEDLVRKWISQRFPADTIRGEEEEKKEGGAQMWIVDPIDGTYNFKHKGSKFGVSVGMVDGSLPKLGAIFFPAENITISAAEGKGAWINGTPIEIFESRRTLKDALILIELPEDPNDKR